MVEFIVNGEKDRCRPGLSLQDYLEAKGADSGKVVAEVNGKILQPAAFREHLINAGDEIEIIHFVGGG